MKECNTKEITSKQEIDLSIIPVSTQKIPFGAWKHFQTQIAPAQHWYEHYLNDGYVGVLTGKVSRNFEAIDIDTKNDPTNKIAEEYRAIIPDELFSRLIVVKTPSGGYHYYYRCPEATIEPNQGLAWHTDGKIIIETRGEGGYICSHPNDYKVIQGTFDLMKVIWEIPEITVKEREFLLETARTLNRCLPKPKKEYTYKSQAINDFNESFEIIPLFEKHNWKVVDTDNEKVLLLREGSTAHHSATYLRNEKLFFCFSTSTAFTPKNAYNHFQVLQVLEGRDDYKVTLKLLSDYGYSSPENTRRNKISDNQIADYLNQNGVRLDLFLQELTINGKLIEEIDNNTLYINMNQHFETEVSRSKFENVMKSHYIEKMHPVMDFIKKYIDRKPTGTIDQWVNCLTLKNPDVDKNNIVYFVKKWYVGMIAQALDGEYPNEFFLCLTSTRQGVGKTTLLRKFTLPAELQGYRKEVSISDDEDFQVIMSQALLIIDDEMDGRTLNEDKTFKAILSRKELPLRRKYDRRISNLVRRCSFAGCGNQVNVVRERQNRRIIPIEVEAIDHNKIAEVNLIDLFMEAYHLYNSNFRYSYDGSDSEKINRLAGDYHLKTDLDEIVDEAIENPIDEQDQYQITSIEVIQALTYKYPEFTRRINSPAIGKIMADRGFKPTRKGKNRITCYIVSRKSNIVNVIAEINGSHNSQIPGFERK